MTRSSFRCLVSALLGAALLGGTGAQARAIYTGTFDPAYGSPFDDLGWRGTANFELDTACLKPAGFSGIVNTGVNGCTADVTAATVNFYILPVAPSTEDTGNKASITHTAPVAISQLLFSNGTLVGIATDLFDRRDPVPLGGADLGALFNGNVPQFALDFDLGTYDINNNSNTVVFGGTYYNGPRLYWTRGQGAGCTDSECNGVNGSAAENIPTFEIRPRTTNVPEPGSLMLTLAALLAAGAVARRRR